MKNVIGWMLGMAIAPLASGQTPSGGGMTDPLEILRKADAAVKAIHSIKYNVTAEGKGVNKDKMGTVTAVFKGDGRSAMFAAKYLGVTESNRPASEQSSLLDIGSDGKHFFVVDHDNKTMHKGTAVTVQGKVARRMTSVFLMEFLNADGLGKEISASSRALKSEKTVFGEECYQVHVVYRAGNFESTWCISKKDFLPREREDFFTLPSGESAGVVKTISNIDLNPKFGPDEFRLTIPEGYAETADAAP